MTYVVLKQTLQNFASLPPSNTSFLYYYQFITHMKHKIGMEQELRAEGISNVYHVSLHD